MTLFDRLHRLETRHPVPRSPGLDAWITTLSDDDLDVCCRFALDRVVTEEDRAAFERLGVDYARNVLAASTAP